MKKKETPNVSNKRVDNLCKSIRQKVANNPLRFRAYNKVSHMNNAELAEFIGETVRKKLTKLAFVSTLTIAKADEFVVGQKFQHRQKEKTGIQMWFGDNFRNWIFNPMSDRKVKLSKNIKLDKLCLLVDRHDTEMQNEVGHKPFKITNFLPMLWSILSKQKNGEEGFLLNNGYANIFHVELEDGRVVAVYARWHGDGWNLNAYDLDYNGRWYADNCLFVPATV